MSEFNTFFSTNHQSHSVRKMLLSVFAAIGLAMLLALPGATEAKAKIGELPKDSISRRQLQLLNGRQISLMDMRGKVAVINFFAVWCGHSRLHIPSLTKFGEQDFNRGLQIVGLAVDDAETTPERVNEFIQKMKITYPVGMVEDSVFRKYVESKDVSVPQTLVYGRDGKLVAHFIGHDDSIATLLAETVNQELSK